MDTSSLKYADRLAGVGPCPVMTPDDRKFTQSYCNKMAQIRKWAWELGRVAKFEGPPNEYDRDLSRVFRVEMIKSDLEDDEQCEINDALEAGRNDADQPKDAPERVAKAARWYTDNMGAADVPETFRRCKRYTELWIAILIQGYKGRRFPFAENRVAKAFGYPSAQTVGNFMRRCVSAGFVRCVSYGRPNDPKCRRPYHSQKAGAANMYILARRRERNMVERITPKTSSCRTSISRELWSNCLKKECPWIYTPVVKQVG